MAMAPNWDDLRVFLTLAREGTLTTAAKALGVSHPTVARRVRALEKQIGARLMTAPIEVYITLLMIYFVVNRGLSMLMRLLEDRNRFNRIFLRN